MVLICFGSFRTAIERQQSLCNRFNSKFKFVVIVATVFNFLDCRDPGKVSMRNLMYQCERGVWVAYDVFDLRRIVQCDDRIFILVRSDLTEPLTGCLGQNHAYGPVL